MFLAGGVIPLQQRRAPALPYALYCLPLVSTAVWKHRSYIWGTGVYRSSVSIIALLAMSRKAFTPSVVTPSRFSAMAIVLDVPSRMSRMRRILIGGAVGFPQLGVNAIGNNPLGTPNVLGVVDTRSNTEMVTSVAEVTAYFFVRGTHERGNTHRPNIPERHPWVRTEVVRLRGQRSAALRSREAAKPGHS